MRPVAAVAKPTTRWTHARPHLLLRRNERGRRTGRPMLVRRLHSPGMRCATLISRKRTETAGRACRRMRADKRANLHLRSRLARSSAPRLAKARRFELRPALRCLRHWRKNSSGMPESPERHRGPTAG